MKIYWLLIDNGSNMQGNVLQVDGHLNPSTIVSTMRGVLFRGSINDHEMAPYCMHMM